MPDHDDVRALLPGDQGTSYSQKPCLKNEKAILGSMSPPMGFPFTMGSLFGAALVKMTVTLRDE